MRLNAKTALAVFLDWLVGLCGVLGSLLCLSSAFSIPIPGGIYPLAALLLALLCVIFRFRRGNRIAAVTALLGLALLFLFRRSLVYSFLALWNRLAVHYVKGYSWMQDYVGDGRSDFISLSPALIALVSLEVFFEALSLARFKRVLPGAFFLLLGVIPCFILTDTPPDLLPFLMVAFSIAVQALSQNVRRRECGDGSKGVAWAALLSGLLLAAVLILYPRETYEPPVTWDELAKKLSKVTESLDRQGNVSAGLTGNPAVVDLNDLRSLSDRPEKVMTVTTDYSGRIYLRCSSYADFDGSSWSRGDQKPWGESPLYPLLGSQRVGWSLKIHTETVEPAMYTTYDLLSLPLGGPCAGDQYYRNSSERVDYAMQFFDSKSAPGVHAVQSPEYESWVYETYLRLPETTRRSVLEWLERQNLSSPDEDKTSTGARAEQIAAAVRSCASYSRRAPDMPDGVDFCTWFLNEADYGYCVHFATATVALLRADGIPARYVSGYSCDLTPGTTEVTSLHAHAWAEYYDGGMWRPVEPTPSEATEFTGQIPQMTDDNIIPEVTRPTVPVPPSTEPTAPVIDESDIIPPTERSTESTEARPGGSELSDKRKEEDIPLPPWLPYVLGGIGFVTLVWLRRRLTLLLRARRLRRASPNDCGRLLYRRYLRLSRYTKARPSPEVERVAMKAGFSQHELSEAELDILYRGVQRQIVRMELRGPLHKFYYRYVLAII